MQDITSLVARYRECVSSLWNTYFHKPNVDWDEQWSFAVIDAELFKALVLQPLGRGGVHIQPDYMNPRELLSFMRVVPDGAASILMNREIDSGYWDWRHPLPKVQAEDVDLRMFHFFDWDSLGPRNYDYVRVLILDSARYPEANGKHALIASDEVRFTLLDDCSS